MRIQERIYTPGLNAIERQRTPNELQTNLRRTLDYCGGAPLSLLLDGGGAFLSFFGEVLSLLNTPTILPKKLFFLLASSSDWTPGAGCGFPFVAGGGSAFSEFPPNMREKNPCTPPLWSQVSRGSVPATKAMLEVSRLTGVARRVVILSSSDG